MIAAVPLVCLATITSALPASAPVIGLAVSQGRMEIERAPVEGSGSLTNGIMLSSAASPARIRLTNGNGATLAANSRARVFIDRIVLEKGQVLSTSAGYRTEASGFQAVALGVNAQALVGVLAKEIQVSAIRGSVKVTDGRGMVVARIPSGRAISLEPPSSSTAGQSDFTGVLRRDRTGFVLRDDVTDLDVELRGAGLERHTGSRVHATGKAQASADGESQIMLVSRLTVAQAQDSPSQERPPGGNRPDTEQPKTGMSNGAKVAIIAAVAGGAAGGVLAATGKKNESVSR
jgi:hypothetical protein